MNAVFRSGTVNDATACGTICYEAFKLIAQQHNFPPDIPSAEFAIGLLTRVLSRTDVYAIVAEVDHHVIGSNFLWEGDTIASIGPISVTPDAQNSSVGRQLMERVLERARGRRHVGVRLVQSAYHNRSFSLYTKLGFPAREPLTVLQGHPLKMQQPGCHVRPATNADLDACDALCLSIHGHDRHGELVHAIDDGTAKVVERFGQITAYATNIGFFAHAVARTNEDLKALIGTASEFAGPGFLLPTTNAELLRWSLTHGLRVIQPMTLMSLGLYQNPTGAYLPSVLY